MSDPFDDIIANDPLFNGGASQAHAVVGATVRTAPSADASAKAHTLSGQTGIPLPVVQRNLPAVEAQQRPAAVVQNTSGAPAARKAYADPNFAAVAHDDSHPVGLWDRTIGALNWAGDEIGHGLGYLANKATAPLGFKPGEAHALVSSEVGKGFASGVRGIGDIADAAARTFIPFAGQNVHMAPTTKVLGTYLDDKAKLLEARVQNNNLAARVLRVGASIIPYVMTGAAAPALMAAQGADEQQQRADEAGASQDSSDLGVLGNALFQGVLGHTIGKAGEFASAVVPELGGRTLAELSDNLPVALGKVLATAGLRTAARTGAAGAMGGAMALGSNAITKATINPDQPLTEGMGESAAQMAALDLVTHGLHAALRPLGERLQRAATGSADASTLDSLHMVAEASKVRARTPGVWKDYLQQVTQEHGAPESVYVSPDAFNQMAETPEGQVALSNMPEAVRDAADVAAKTGGDVKIPVEDFGTHIAGTPLYEQVADHVKFDPNGYTRAEAQDIMASEGPRVLADLQRAIEAKQGSTEFGASRDRVEAKIKAELDAAGRASPEVNAINAKLGAASIAAHADRLGMTPEEFHAQHGFGISDGSVRTASEAAAAPAEDPVFADVSGRTARAARAEARAQRYAELPESDPFDALDHADANPDGAHFLAKNGDFITVSDDGSGGFMFQSDAQAARMSRAQLLDAIERQGFKPVEPRTERVGETNVHEQSGRGRRPERGTDAPLDGTPQVAGWRGPIPHVVEAARAYAEKAGIPHTRQARYVEADPEFGKRLADAYDAMEHNPRDPKVKEAYDDLKRQTRAQYDTLVDHGYTFSFFDDGSDPYDGSPGQAMKDLRENKHLAVYSTAEGFGSDASVDVADNPLLEDTGLKWPDQNGVERPVLANDLFRAVHDAFGHGIEGAGFRADGEENAWQAHSRLFTGPALAALTTETRGQNSWLNFGPYGEGNRDALLKDTTFADQKTGLLPEWAWTENRAPDKRELFHGPNPIAQGVEHWSGQREMFPGEDLGQAPDPEIKEGQEFVNVDGEERPVRNANGDLIAPRTKAMENFWRWFGDSQMVDDEGRPLVFYHGTQADLDAAHGIGSTLREQFAFDPMRTETFFFASDKETARHFKRGGTSDDHILPVYLAIENVEEYDAEGRMWDEVEHDDDILNEALDAARADYVEREMNAFEPVSRVEQIGDDQWKLYNNLDGESQTFDNEGEALAELEQIEERERDKRREELEDEANDLYEDDLLGDEFSDHNTSTDDLARAHMGRADAVLIHNVDEGSGPTNVAIVLGKPNLIKSTDNRGAFDPSDPRILYQASRALAPDEVAATDPHGNTVVGWTPQRVDDLLRAFAYGHEPERTKAYATWMSPDQFLGLTASESGRALIENRVNADEYEGGLINYERMAAQQQSPMLIVNMAGGRIGETKEIPIYGQTYGHEGRHRMTMLKRAGVTRIPVVLVLNEPSDAKVSALAEPIELAPQRSRSSQLESGDQRASLEGAVPISYANRERLLTEFGQGRVLFQAEPFYSALERAVEGISTARAPAQQWLATLKKAPGVKDEELEWTGIEEWLKMQPGPVEKDAVLQVIRDGGIKVEERVLGDPNALNQRSQYLYPEVERAIRGARDRDEAILQLENDGEAYRVLSKNHPELWGDGTDEGEYNENWAADVVDDLFPNGFAGGTQFGHWTSSPDAAMTSGTYRELLITLPSGEGGNPERVPQTHWSEPGVVAHTRFMDKTGPNGEKVLFVEEVQSDWHQKGRDQGYEEPADPAKIAPAEEALAKAESEWTARAEAFLSKADELLARWKEAVGDIPPSAMSEHGERLARAYETFTRDKALPVSQRVGMARDLLMRTAFDSLAQDEIDALDRARVARDLRGRELDIAKGLITNGGVPNAPFKSSWPALVMKRLIHWAATNGYDQVAWTTGEQQADRYNLSDAVGRISGALNDDGTYDIGLDSGRAERTLIDNGMAVDGTPWPEGHGGVRMTAEQLKEAFGNDVAQRIIDGAAGGKAKRQERVAAYNAALKADNERSERTQTYRKEWRDRVRATLINEGMSEESADKIAERWGSSVYELPGVDAAEYRRGLGKLVDEERETKAAIERAAQARHADVELEGEDLKVGGEGMKAFYDRNLVNITNKIIKKYGAKVEGVAFNEFQPAPSVRDSVESWVAAIGGEKALDTMLAELEREDAANGNDPENQAIRNLGRSHDLYSRNHSPLVVSATTLRAWKELLAQEAEDRPLVTNPGFSITPELRAAASEGFPLFQGGADPRGSFEPDTNTINLLKNANLSTFIHELGHYHLEALQKFAASSPEVAQDFTTALKWMGDLTPEQWRGMSFEQQRPYHEKFARGFEAYLLESKAPSEALRPVFQRMAAWLKAVYQHITGLGVELSPEVRGVMDRLVATSAEIAKAQENQGFSPAFTAKPEFMSDDQWNAYQGQQQQATADAEETLQARSLRDLKWIEGAKSRALKRLQQQVSGLRRDTREEVAKEVNAEPVNRAREFLKRGTIDGQPVEGGNKLSIPEVDALFPDEATREFVKGKLGYGKYGMLGEENAIHPEQAADLFGYNSAQQLIRDLIDAPSASDKIKSETERRLLERHGDVGDPQKMQEAATQAIHNEARGRVLETELAALRRATGNKNDLGASARDLAEQTVARMKVADLKPERFRAEERKAGERAMRALRENDLAKAAEEKRAQVLNFHLARAVDAAREKAAKQARYLKNFGKKSVRQRIGTDIELIDQLLGNYDLRSSPVAEDERQRSLKDWYESAVEGEFEPHIDERLLHPRARTPYAELAAEELQGLHDTVKSIAYVARERNTVTRDGKKIALAAAVAELAERHAEHGVKFTEDQIRNPPQKGDPLIRQWLYRFATGLREVHSVLLGQDFKSNAFDLHRFDGPHRRYIFEPLNRAAYRKSDMTAEVTKRFEDMGKELGKAWQDSMSDMVPNEELADPALPSGAAMKFTREKLIGLALHLGNESNFAKLTGGMGWDGDAVWRFARKNMRAADWRAVQHIWDNFEPLWGESEAMIRRLGGVVPEKIPARPFDVTTPDGETIHLKGGYAPIDYDPRASDLAARFGALDENRTLNEQARNYKATTTRNGSLKNRVEGYSDILNLNWKSSISRNIRDTIHDIAYREALLDIAKIMKNRAFRNSFQSAFGPVNLDALQAMIDNVRDTNRRDDAMNMFERIMRSTRQGVIQVGIGYRLSTVLKHSSAAALKSLGYASGKGKKYFLARSARMATGNAIADFREAREKFPEIRFRLRQMDRDWKATNHALTDRETPLEWINRHGHDMVAYSDAISAVATAHAAYDWAVMEGIPKKYGGTGEPMSHADAVAYADKIVREAHGSALETTRSNFLHDRGAASLLGMIYGFMNNTYGQMADIGSKAGTKGIANTPLIGRAAATLIMPAVMAAWVSEGGPDDVEGWAKWLALAIGGELAATVPGVRDAWGAAMRYSRNGNRFDFGTIPVFRVLGSAMQVPVDAWKELGGHDTRIIQHAFDALGMTFHVAGAGQAGHMLQYQRDVRTGKQEPEDTADYLKHLLVGGMATRH